MTLQLILYGFPLIISLATLTSQSALGENGASHGPFMERVRLRDEQREYWSSVEWTNTIAIDRHIELLQSFERGDRDRDGPLEEFEIPWPILNRPFSYSITSIEKGWVSDFYDAVRSREDLNTDVASLIRRCVKVFHQDKLLSRLRDIGGDETKILINESAKGVFLEVLSQLQRQKGDDPDN